MDTPPPVKKKGMGPLAWLGIGCGGIILLLVIGFIIATVMFGSKAKQFIEEAQKNPTRMTASAMVNMSGGAFEMVAEDDENKRYTVKEKSTGKLTTIYLNPKTNAPETVEGDFSAIPAPSDAPAEAAEAP